MAARSTLSLADKSSQRLSFEYHFKAAFKGEASSMLAIARMFQAGSGIECDLAKADMWLRKLAVEDTFKQLDASEQIDALYFLGSFYKEKGCYQDLLQSFKFFSVGAIIYQDPLCAYELGLAYDFENSYNTEAIKWLNIAAENDDEQNNTCSGNALFKLGQLYRKYIPTQLWVAEIYFERAELKGCLAAKDALDILLEDKIKLKKMRDRKKPEVDARLSLFESLFSESKEEKKEEKREEEKKITVEDESKKILPDAAEYIPDTLEMWQFKAFIGDPVAQLEIARIYNQGTKVSRDTDEYINWLDKAYETAKAKKADTSEIKNEFGTAYDNGDGVIKSKAKAREWYLKAAQDGCSVAQYNIAVMYEKAEGGDLDQVEAVRWYKAGADQHEISCEFYYGKACADGRGIQKNDKDAEVYITRSAFQGLVDAQLYIGLASLDGSDIFPKNKVIAQHWLKKAADQDNAKAQFYYGKLCDNADRNIYIKKAADNGFVPAILHLASEAEEKGDLDTAKKYYITSDHRKIKHRLALIYLVSGDTFNQGVKLLEEAAEDSYPQSQYTLGMLYFERKLPVTLNDYSQAYKWFKRAADNGLKEAQCAFAELHEKGLGCRRDLDEALSWYGEAAIQGDKKAKERVCSLNIIERPIVETPLEIESELPREIQHALTHAPKREPVLTPPAPAAQAIETKEEKREEKREEKKAVITESKQIPFFSIAEGKNGKFSGLCHRNYLILMIELLNQINQTLKKIAVCKNTTMISIYYDSLFYQLTRFSIALKAYFISLGRRAPRELSLDFILNLRNKLVHPLNLDIKLEVITKSAQFIIKEMPTILLASPAISAEQKSELEKMKIGKQAPPSDLTTMPFYQERSKSELKEVPVLSFDIIKTESNKLKSKIKIILDLYKKTKEAEIQLDCMNALKKSLEKLGELALPVHCVTGIAEAQFEKNKDKEFIYRHVLFAHCRVRNKVCHALPDDCKPESILSLCEQITQPFKRKKPGLFHSASAPLIDKCSVPTLSRSMTT